MLETAVALLFAHVMADFVLQTEGMVRGKRRAGMLLLHGAVVGATAWAALGMPLVPLPFVALVGAHMVIDWTKVRFGGTGFGAFALDQAGHLATIGVIATVWPWLWEAGLWSRPAIEAVPAGALLPAAMAFGAGLVGAVWAGTYAVGSLMQGLRLPADPDDDPSLPQGGRIIGQLERFVILILVLAGETLGIGLLIAAKSILRFGEVQKGRQVAEYVIIGTLASFSWALPVAIGTAWLLARL